MLLLCFSDRIACHWYQKDEESGYTSISSYRDLTKSARKAAGQWLLSLAAPGHFALCSLENWGKLASDLIRSILTPAEGRICAGIKWNGIKGSLFSRRQASHYCSQKSYWKLAYAAVPLLRTAACKAAVALTKLPALLPPVGGDCRWNTQALAARGTSAFVQQASGGAARELGGTCPSTTKKQTAKEERGR